MTRYQSFQNAIEAYQPGAAALPIVFFTTELNEKGFKALTGRKLKWSLPVFIIIGIAIIILFSAIAAIFSVFGGHPGGAGGASGAIFVAIILPVILRSTLITAGAEGLDFYYVKTGFGSKCTVYDKMSLPYDRLTGVRVKRGKVFKNTQFIFEFMDGDKKIKIKTTANNRMRKVDEHIGNLEHLLGVLKQRGFIEG